MTSEFLVYTPPPEEQFPPLQTGYRRWIDQMRGAFKTVRGDPSRLNKPSMTRLKQIVATMPRAGLEAAFIESIADMIAVEAERDTLIQAGNNYRDGFLRGNKAFAAAIEQFDQLKGTCDTLATRLGDKQSVKNKAGIKLGWKKLPKISVPWLFRVVSDNSNNLDWHRTRILNLLKQKV